MRKLIYNKNNIYIVITVLVLKIILDIGYVFIINSRFEHFGFYLEINYVKFIESTLITIILALLLLELEKNKRLSRIVIYILFFNLYLPISSLYWLMNESRSFYYLSFLFFLILIIIISRIKLYKIPQISVDKKLIFILLTTVTLIVYIYLIVTGGLSRINFNILDVYETRADYVANNIRIFGYLIPWQANIINMFFLVYGVYRKNKLLIATALILQLFLFSMTNFKSILFSPIVVVAILLIFKSKVKEKLLITISSSLSLTLIILYLYYFATNNWFLISIFVRRLFFVPAKMNYIYYDFFSGKEKYYLSTSIFEGFISAPYSLTPVKLIALEVFGRDFSPNVGIIGDAYLNFGAIGIILYALILGLYLWIFDSVTQNMHQGYGMALIVIPSIALVNSALFTSLLTHGLIVTLLLLFLVKDIFNNDVKKGFLK